MVANGNSTQDNHILFSEVRSTIRSLLATVTELAEKFDSVVPAGKLPVSHGQERALPLSRRDDPTDRLIRKTKAPLPDPRLVRRIIRQRQLRARFFDGDLFADPAWDMLLDLTAARAEHTRVSVTSLCIASNVPPTTALRWIGQMSDAGLLERIEDEVDRRRAFITLASDAADTMARFFAELEKDAAWLV